MITVKVQRIHLKWDPGANELEIVTRLMNFPRT